MKFTIKGIGGLWKLVADDECILEGNVSYSSMYLLEGIKNGDGNGVFKTFEFNAGDVFTDHYGATSTTMLSIDLDQCAKFVTIVYMINDKILSTNNPNKICELQLMKERRYSI